MWLACAPALGHAPPDEWLLESFDPAFESLGQPLGVLEQVAVAGLENGLRIVAVRAETADERSEAFGIFVVEPGVREPKLRLDVIRSPDFREVSLSLRRARVDSVGVLLSAGIYDVPIERRTYFFELATREVERERRPRSRRAEARLARMSLHAGSAGKDSSNTGSARPGMLAEGSSRT